MCLEPRDNHVANLQAPKDIAIIAREGVLHDVEEQEKEHTRVAKAGGVQLAVVHSLVLSFSSRQPLDGLHSTKIHLLLMQCTNYYWHIGVDKP